MHLRGPRRRDAAARPDPVRRAAAAHDHPRRRGHRASASSRPASATGCRTSRCWRWTSSPAPARSSPTRPGRATCSTRSPTPTALSATRPGCGSRSSAVPGGVALRHVRFDDAGLLAKTIAEIVETATYDGVRVDGLDGVAFEPGEYYLTLATWTTGHSAGEPDQRLRRPGRLLPEHPAARDRPADDVRLPVALGHRLVLVLGRLRRAEPARSGGSGRGAGGAPTSTTSCSAWTGASRSPTGSTAAPAGRCASG